MCEGTQAESSVIYAEEPTSVWVLKDKVGGDQQKSLFFLLYLIASLEKCQKLVKAFVDQILDFSMCFHLPFLGSVRQLRQAYTMGN